MEVTVGPPSVIRPGKGAASPSHAGAMALPGAVTAPEPCPQATGPVPWPPPGTRRPWQVAPAVRISCGALLPCQAGRSTSPWDDARAHQHLPAGRTPLRMRVPTLGTRRLPVHRHGRLHRRLPKRSTADGEGINLAGAVPPTPPHHPPPE